jgi:uncharacterized membrane protein
VISPIQKPLPAGFDLPIPGTELPQTYALDGAATGIMLLMMMMNIIIIIIIIIIM